MFMQTIKTSVEVTALLAQDWYIDLVILHNGIVNKNLVK